MGAVIVIFIVLVSANIIANDAPELAQGCAVLIGASIAVLVLTTICQSFTLTGDPLLGKLGSLIVMIVALWLAAGNSLESAPFRDRSTKAVIIGCVVVALAMLVNIIRLSLIQK